MTTRAIPGSPISRMRIEATSITRDDSNAMGTSEQQAFYAELKSLTDFFEAMQPELEVTVRDPALGVEGYVVVWNTGVSAGGPLERSGKGGTRITPTVSLEEVKMLARTMALKNAAAGL